MRVRIVIRDEEKVVRVRRQLIVHVYIDAILRGHDTLEEYRSAHPGGNFTWETRLQKGGQDEYQVLERGDQDTLVRES